MQMNDPISNKQLQHSPFNKPLSRCVINPFPPYSPLNYPPPASRRPPRPPAIITLPPAVRRYYFSEEAVRTRATSTTQRDKNKFFCQAALTCKHFIPARLSGSVMICDNVIFNLSQVGWWDGAVGGKQWA
ncbi:hypothetical protein GWI33_004281 [Rhynchophorus ferrugineus]|uniref:Uncharacterized protein n=1 Tax=Rhynchophorus ferrugineus TaxID=354439 RepID=A0A834IJ03_RHYFE|nr:hypothetical protein GWI33_004281 [Rhynchophorus ferrugineus]